MSSPPANQANQSSGSEGGPRIGMDERKRKRMLSNRESARRSRMRKVQRVDELVNEAAKLRDENVRIAAKADVLEQQYLMLDSGNDILRAQMMELTQRLQSLNSVLHFVGDFSGMAMDIPEIPDPLLEPWQLPYPAPPIMASMDMLQF